MTDISHRIAQELGVRPDQVKATVELLDSGATVPFVARYRKEATGGLDDAQLRSLEERLGYLRELDARREVVLKAIEEQGKLTDSLGAAIREADTKTRLEDLYRPYMKKRRTKAQIARENGLEPLLDALLADPALVPEAVAAGYATEDITVEAALEGAGHIFMERIAEDADLIDELRNFGWERGFLVSRVVPGKEQAGARFRDYFDHVEPLSKAPSHRALAMFRGQAEECLRLEVAWTEAQARGEEETATSPGEAAIARRFRLSDKGRPADAWLARHARLAWRAKLSIHLDVALKRRLRDLADEEAIRVFGANLQDVLLAAPAGSRTTMGLDPGVRTGVKVAVINGQGAVVETATVYPFPPRNQVQETLETLSALARKHQVDLVAIGNGTYSRETDALVGELMRLNPKLGLTKVVISEAGASVYSASALASAELPDLDVSLRGAVSIARRLQDPLAELVKIEPNAIGVGQYQHDVNQGQLARKLEAVVEDCVNGVGVDVNTASVPLLARVSGLGPTLAENIVAFRSAQGPFASRSALKAVPRLGAKAFEQAAGFLRIPRGKDPLDASAVHPEAYPVVRRIVAETGRDVRELIGDEAFLKRLDPSRFTDGTFGEPTVRDILTELAKPGRDPRPEFRTAAFKAGVERLQDLQPGMVLEGTVTNVANFGAFVDVGVHQDGLVHISVLSDRFIKDPRDVVRAGDVVKVKVMEVDLERKRIALSMRLDDEPGREAPGRPSAREARGGQGRKGGAVRKETARTEPQPEGALAAALKAAAGRK
ncbi:Tex family protein [Ectothiorhodospira lacustris]|uniref:Tex family protein n=1 Tax=Ectothiorhodospira lacustris TaxID=2899127 RepID=UPI001EE8C390|nr:Tex family protein [Ectothiorhodospira lacustris]MCG5501262.1 RNA-binding transcriptional accessory protein [Ectothiorhodospira lacustris]MCG5509464.1 RNA-binding transcriptional accessory protein [Ectothiorhodospira lacustris]MCG5521518.1 RNA-binding transcriptional accessory protein [Ectothiorhodospira lacustris]